MTQCTPIRMRTPRQVKGSSISTICRRANNGQVNNTVDGVTGETITYQYDSLKRLLTATSAIHGSTSWQENYTYDGFGNLTTMAPYPTLNMGVNWQTNQLTNGTGYDSYGNVTSLPPPSTTTMSYDVGNRMVNVNGAQVYAYDQGNQRVYYRNTSGVETIYLYGAGGQKLAAYQTTVASQAITLTFQSGNVYFAGKLVGAENNAVAVDGLGSVRWSAAGGGHTYYPYGVEYSTSSGDTEKYATYTRDSLTGFDYAMHRYYFSQWGRFISPDPSWGSARPGLPQSWNRYWYANGDPVNNSDPSGLDGVCGPYGTWMGEGCYNYSSGPSADINEAYNQYVTTLADTIGWVAGEDPVAVLQAAAQNFSSPDPNCVQDAIAAAAQGVGLNLTGFSSISVQIVGTSVGTSDGSGSTYGETELNLTGSPAAVTGLVGQLCNLGFYNNNECQSNSTILVGQPHSGYTGNFRSQGLTNSVQVNTATTTITTTNSDGTTVALR